MSAWELRWILLVIGGFILIAIYFFSKRHRPDVSHDLLDESPKLEDDLSVSLNPAQDKQDLELDEHKDDLYGLQKMLKEEASTRPPRESVTNVARMRPAPQTSADSQSLDEKIVILHVAQPRPNLIQGEALWRALESSQLDYGESEIYHRTVERFGERQIVFSVSNMVKPGTLTPQQLINLATPGISLFMRLPGPLEGLKAFNTMLDCAQALAAKLDAKVLDESRSVLTQQSIDHLREAVQLFSLRHSG